MTPLSADLQRLVDENRGLVYHFSPYWKRRSRPEDRDDLIQEGMLGLIEAAKHYRPEVGVTFSTYARPWIVRGFRECIRKQRLVRIPEKKWRLDKSPELLSEITMESGETRPEGSDRGTQAQASERHMLARDLALSFRVFTPRQRVAMELYFVADATLEEVGMSMGISRESVRQLVYRAIPTVRRAAGVA